MNRFVKVTGEFNFSSKSRLSDYSAYIPVQIAIRDQLADLRGGRVTKEGVFDAELGEGEWIDLWDMKGVLSEFNAQILFQSDAGIQLWIEGKFVKLADDTSGLKERNISWQLIQRQSAASTAEEL